MRVALVWCHLADPLLLRADAFFSGPCCRSHSDAWSERPPALPHFAAHIDFIDFTLIANASARRYPCGLDWQRGGEVLQSPQFGASGDRPPREGFGEI